MPITSAISIAAADAARVPLKKDKWNRPEGVEAQNSNLSDAKIIEKKGMLFLQNRVLLPKKS